MCSGGTVDNQLREAFCVKSIPVAEYTSRNELLGCPAVFYEEALLEFFANGTVRDELVVITVHGVPVAISERLFAETFELPVEGLTDLTDVPKDNIFDARSLFSASKEQVSVSCFKKEMKIEYRLLHDILAKTLFVKAWYFDADDKQSDRAETWFDRAFDEMLRNDSPVVTPSDTDEEEVTIDVGATGGDQQVEFSAEGTTDDESLSIEEHQARIPFNASLPSTLAPTITPIRFGQGIEFREVDAYKGSLPQIDASDKGKGILVEDDVQGHPAREIFSLICADIEFLIALREKVIEDVSIFVISFSLRKLATLQSEDIFAKEGQVLSWAETDSSFVAIQRRRLIIAKYRELLLRKFIEARRKNLVSGTPTSAIDLKVLKLLGAAHLFASKVLLRNMREHQLEWTRPSSSSLFEVPVIDRGFFIPPNHHSITSKCWIRAKIMVYGSWLILEGVDYWRPINTPVNSRHWEALPQRPYLDDLAPLCVFIESVQDIDSRPSLSRAISIFWAEICMEAVQFSLLGSLRPVGSVNFCRELVVRGSVVEVIETLPICFRRIIQHGINCNSFVDSVVQLDSAEIQEVDVQGIDEVDLFSSEGSTVYRSPSPIFQETDSFDHNLRFALGPAIPVVAQEEKLYYVEGAESRQPTSPRQETSASSSSDSPVHLNGDDIPLEENVSVRTTFPAATVDLSPLLDDLKTSLSQRMDNAQSDILSRLHTIERGLQNTLGHQNDYFRNLIQNARQEGQNQDDLQILRLNELKKTVMAQGVTADTDSLAVRNRFNALDAKIILLDGQVAAIRSEQLEFQAKMAVDLLSLSTQIGDLVDYILGGDAKKGKEAAVASLYLLLLTKVKAVVMLSELQRLSHKQTLTLHSEILWKE
ncbi:hypothetical protein F511_38333 [Dorcoceras hygrometricum]|uniref:Uncharacterized protein n=1 Tax=Dorcoceras hygrometricum TaxID=472368 RepID=A0A2Z7BEA1_9LAMI|nr:hypothetical protein F511_38333 [Dorcoceras hygrometricum]